MTMLATAYAPQPRPVRIQVLPVPQADPPYDDELDRDDRHDCGERQGALALTFHLPNGLPALPAAPAGPVLHVVPAVETADEGEDSFEARPTPRAELPDPRGFGARLVQALVEVVSGARPAGQLMRWTNEAVYTEINRRVRLLARGGAPGNRGIIAGALRSLHVSEPSDGVAEICAVVQRGPRALAVAVRLDGLDGRWQCTAVDFG